MLHCFDVDGTLIRSFMREGIIDSYDDVEVLPRRVQVIKRLAERPEQQFAIVSNQGGVAFGYQTEDQVRSKMAKVAAELEFFHGRPFSIHLAFGHPKAKLDEYRVDDDMRKPGPGMLNAAMQAHGTTTEDTYFVGDLPTDEECAKAAGVVYYDAEFFFA